MRIALTIVGILATAALAEAQAVASPEARLKEAGIELPPPAQRGLGNYVGAVRTGTLVFLAGQGPISSSEARHSGKSGCGSFGGGGIQGRSPLSAESPQWHSAPKSARWIVSAESSR